MPTYSTHKLAAFAKLTEEVEIQKTWTPFSPSLLFLHQIFFIMIFFHSLMPAKCGNSLRRVCDKYQFSTSLFLLLIHDGTRDLFNMLHLACLICLIQFWSISIEFFLHSTAAAVMACWRATYVYSLFFLLAHRFPMSGFFHFLIHIDPLKLNYIIYFHISFISSPMREIHHFHVAEEENYWLNFSIHTRPPAPYFKFNEISLNNFPNSFFIDLFSVNVWGNEHQ